MSNIASAGAFRLGDRTVNRMGYGAMQLAGPNVFGPPKNWDEALAVLREAVASGINHIDTSDVYGPHLTNQLLAAALHPYPRELVIVTKLGAFRGEDGSWRQALGRDDLTDRFTITSRIFASMYSTWLTCAFLARSTSRARGRSKSRLLNLPICSGKGSSGTSA